MSRFDRSLIAFVGIGMLAAFGTLAWLAFGYVRLETYFDHAEPAVVVRAWRWLAGGALFPAATETIFQRTGYGPVLHLLDAASLALLGPSIQVSKLAAFIAAILTPVILAGICVRRFGLVPGLLAGLGMAAFQLIMGPPAMWNRPDPFLVLTTVLALALAPMDQTPAALRPWRLFGIAVLIGVATNLKVHAFFYFFPILVAYARARFLFTWPVLAAISVLAFLAPFALPGIGLQSYLEMVFSVSVGRPLDPNQVLPSLRWGAFCLAPWIPWIAGRIAGTRGTMAGFAPGLLALTAGLAVITYPASSRGSDWIHYAPLIPIALQMTAQGMQALANASWARLAVVLLVALPFALTAWVPAKRMARHIETLRTYEPAAADIRAILARYPNAAIEMGYGSDNAVTYRNTFTVPLLAFGGHPVVLLAVAAMEDRAAGLPPPAPKMEWLDRRVADIILVPKGEYPFSLNSFLEDRWAFWPEMTNLFRARYRVTETIGRFDLWRPVETP